ncbi:MAG: gliding motility-associated C-terminal domain-containing protein, partial [Flavobacterium sp.]|nr:gliding motility-associated C-terminal domain-containing protein [Flavobacterium sp.]
DPLHSVLFFETENDAIAGVNQLLSLANFDTATPRQIFIRVTDAFGCVAITSFTLQTRNCPPTVYNFVSANGDGANDTFFVEGLRDIFLNFKMEIYNRWGVLIWRGDPSLPDWDGIATNGTLVGSGPVPDGTYYYVLHLNDPDYAEPMTGFLYITR